MENLAGVSTCDTVIVGELVIAGINLAEQDKGRDEVPYTIFGYLGPKMGEKPKFHESKDIEKMVPFIFLRAWYYYRVHGSVPLEVANILYKLDTGGEIRVAGHCGAPPPEEWAHNGRVDCYHIDSQEGLNLFVKTLKEHGVF